MILPRASVMAEEDEGVKCDEDPTDGQIVFSILVPPSPRTNGVSGALNDNALSDQCSGINPKPSFELGVRCSECSEQQQQRQQDEESQQKELKQMQQQQLQLQQQPDLQQQQYLDPNHLLEQPQQRLPRLQKKQLSWSCEDIRVFEVPSEPSPDKPEPHEAEETNNKVKVSGEVNSKVKLRQIKQTERSR